MSVTRLHQSCIPATVFAIILASTISSRADKPAPLPMKDKVAGAYVGFPPGGMDYFFKLDLNVDGTGYFIWADGGGGCDSYRVTSWSLKNHDCEIVLKPLHQGKNEDMGMFIKCRVESPIVLRCEIGSKRYNWKNEVDLRSEAFMLSANENTKAKIRELERQRKVEEKKK